MFISMTTVKVSHLINILKHTDIEIDVLTNYKDVLYKTSNGTVGESANMISKSGPFGRSCAFTNSLAKAGNYVNNGLNCHVEKEKCIDQSKDWMMKN